MKFPSFLRMNDWVFGTFTWAEDRRSRARGKDVTDNLNMVQLGLDMTLKLNRQKKYRYGVRTGTMYRKCWGTGKMSLGGRRLRRGKPGEQNRGWRELNGGVGPEWWARGVTDRHTTRVPALAKEGWGEGCSVRNAGLSRVSSSCAADKGLTSGMRKWLKSESPKPNHPVKKWARELSKQFSEVQLPNTYIQNVQHSTCQENAHLSFTKILSYPISNGYQEEEKEWWWAREAKPPSHLAAGNVNQHSYSANQCGKSRQEYSLYHSSKRS